MTVMERCRFNVVLLEVSLEPSFVSYNVKLLTYDRYYTKLFRSSSISLFSPLHLAGDYLEVDYFVFDVCLSAGYAFLIFLAAIFSGDLIETSPLFDNIGKVISYCAAILASLLVDDESSIPHCSFYAWKIFNDWLVWGYQWVLLCKQEEMDYKLQVGIPSQIEMGSFPANVVINEFEIESDVSSRTGTPQMQPDQINDFSFSSGKNPWESSSKTHPRHVTEYDSISGSFGIRRSKFYIFWRSIRIVILSNKLNALMAFGPLAILVHILTDHKGWVFFLSLVGIIPLAERLGYCTEQLAFYTGSTVGGLLNATFGNATELIIAIYALKRSMIRVVQLSLLGSILSNMLPVLGCAFLAGGLSCGKQEFDKAVASVSSGLLLMAVMGLLFPAVLHYTHTEIHYGTSELALSRFSSCVMLLVYAAYIFFQLQSPAQKDYSQLDEEESKDEDASDTTCDAPEISKWESLIWLCIMTAWISVLSEYLVDAIEGTSKAWNIPIAFIGVILLPIVGNAAEHASAIIFAMKNKLDISLGVAIGSSTQISMFGIPFCVVIGWAMGQSMDLNFQLFETATLFITVIVVAFFIQEGESNYFKGLMLILCYAIVAASFFVHEDDSSSVAIH